ncbi:protein tyrosine phosphatase [Rhodococcus sp. SRB_17]|uniref:low molecular weight protein-tyrosine-phosphatase n=1 Tax=Rhodococcus sp. OK302 TaxID=1882769 RepID=UPI000B940633|nr:low molecular weight protein-tyrosine-phosphatase [Rhodococcus sp. OK302]NMM88179.1 protein tyrosine phosphatase [Rhodococcus sp. SRB_17]OYD70946.1 protein-tyrosine phosphatase [Rhodococcus sp. OK302]
MAASEPLHVTFVCTGNICRSPMAEKILLGHLQREGLDDRVRVSSAGIENWHSGKEADERTNIVLRAANYPTGHSAAQVDPDHLSADLVVPLDTGHDRELAHLGVPTERRRLLRSFDRDADGSSVPDPYYGDFDGFELVRDQIEAAIPDILVWIRERL